MAVTGRLHQEMKNTYEKLKDTTDDPLELLRAHCLSRGASGIKGLGLVFRIMDDDGSKSLSLAEFKKGMRDYGIFIDAKKAQETFAIIDADGSGTIDFDEFLRAIRKLDKTRDGIITIEDLQGTYKVNKHPKYLSGEWSEEQCLRKFLDSFDSAGHPDGTVTLDEFTNYYAGVSASIDSDAYFDLMMRNAWKL